MFYIFTPSITEIQVSPEAFASKGGGGGEPEPKEAAALQWGRREAVAGKEGDGSSMGGYHHCVPLSGRFDSAHKALARVGSSTLGRRSDHATRVAQASRSSIIALASAGLHAGTFSIFGYQPLLVSTSLYGTYNFLIDLHPLLLFLSSFFLSIPINFLNTLYIL